MSKQLPPPGTYQARLNGRIVVFDEESGALMAYIPYCLVGSEIPYSNTHAYCLGSKDGNPQKRNIAVLKKIFPDWDETNPRGLQEIEPNTDGVAQFELQDMFHDEYTKEGETEPSYSLKATWLNPLGGGGPSMKEPMDDAMWKKTLAKWGGKFKAVAGGKSASAAPAAKAAAPTAPAKPAAASGGPPSRRASTGAMARTSSQPEVWAALCKANPGKSDDDLAAPYWEAQDKLFPGRNGDLKPAEWGAVADELGL